MAIVREHGKQHGKGIDIALSTRSFAIAEAIMEQIGSPITPCPSMQRPSQTAEWPPEPTDTHYRLEKYDGGAAGKKYSIRRCLGDLTLEHFEVQSVGGMETVFKLDPIDGNRAELDSDAKKDVQQQIHGILAQIDPGSTEKALQDSIDSRFHSMIESMV